MSARESAWQAGMDAAEALAPETGLFARLDPADFGESVLSVLARAAARPAEVAGASLRCGTAVAGAWPVATARWSSGSEVTPPVPVDGTYRRFADPRGSSTPATSRCGRRIWRPGG